MASCDGCGGEFQTLAGDRLCSRCLSLQVSERPGIIGQRRDDSFAEAATQLCQRVRQTVSPTVLIGLAVAVAICAVGAANEAWRTASGFAVLSRFVIEFFKAAAGLGILFGLFLAIRAWFRGRTALIDEARRQYDRALDQVRRSPSDPNVREYALVKGREYYDTLQRVLRGRRITDGDELRIKNDLDAASAGK